MSRALIPILESVYSLQLDGRAWLHTVTEVMAAQIDEGLGAMAMMYDRHEGERRVLGMDGCGKIGENLGVVPEVGMILGPERLARLMDEPCAGTGSQLLRMRAKPYGELSRDVAARTGFFDLWQVNAVNPTGEGVLIGAPMRQARWLTRAETATWNRVAAHLASAMRLRRTLGIAPVLDEGGKTAVKMPDGEAVLDPSGKTIHAEAEATSKTARTELRDAAIAVDRARRKKNRDDPKAIDAWKAMVDARWTLVDRFDSDGRRFYIAYRNDIPMRDPRKLTPREQQAVAFAALGSTSKLIAYELGLSISSVTTLLSSAARKLGVRSRAELVVLARTLLA